MNNRKFYLDYMTHTGVSLCCKGEEKPIIQNISPLGIHSKIVEAILNDRTEPLLNEIEQLRNSNDAIKSFIEEKKHYHYQSGHEETYSSGYHAGIVAMCNDLLEFLQTQQPSSLFSNNNIKICPTCNEALHETDSGLLECLECGTVFNTDRSERQI